MTDSDAERAYQEQSRILDEGGTAEPGHRRGSGSSVEVRVSPNGEVVIRVEAGAGATGQTAPPSGTGCACRCAYCAPHGLEWLATLHFDSEQEPIVQEAVRVSDGPRDQLLERLFERAAARLITEEAIRFIEEAETAASGDAAAEESP